MVKLIGTGIWVCIVTLVAVYFSIQFAIAPDTPPPVDEEAKKAAQETVAGDMVTVPVLANGGVEGYFLAKISYIADKAKVAEMGPAIKEIIADILYTDLMGNKLIDLGHTDEFKLEEFRASVKEAINKKLGEDVVIEVLVTQLEYISKAAIAANKPESKVSIVAEQPAAEAGKEEKKPAH